jgi:hypothetical protein
LQIVFHSYDNVPGAPITNVVHCPAGTHVISGGYSANLTGTEVGQSFPLATADGWAVSTFRPSGLPFSLTVIAICGNLALGGPNPVNMIVPSYRLPIDGR